ncbi:hypothetical protein FI667_g10770, partial [Globisporangium splendens]
MKDTFDRSDIVSAVTRGKPGYANLNQLNVGSPGSDISDLDDTTDLEELLAQGSSRGPQTHPAHCWFDREQQFAVHQGEASAWQEEIVARHQHLPGRVPLSVRLWDQRDVFPACASSPEGVSAVSGRPCRLNARPISLEND